MLASSEATMTLPEGVALHARPAALFVRTAMRFRSKIIVAANGREADAKSILSVLGLGATAGTDAAGARRRRRRRRRARRAGGVASRRRRVARAAGAPATPPRLPTRRRARAARWLRRLPVIQRAHPCPDPRDRGRADAELVDAQSDEQRHHQRIRRRLAAHLDGDPGGASGVDGVGDQPEHRRVMCRRSRPGRVRSMPSWKLVRSLVPMLNMPTSGAMRSAMHRGRRNLDHRGHERHPTAPARGDRLDGGSHRAHLTGLGHHRDQDRSSVASPVSRIASQLRRRARPDPPGGARPRVRGLPEGRGASCRRRNRAGEPSPSAR